MRCYPLLHLILVAAVGFTTVGCGSSQQIAASDPSERETLNASIQSKDVILHLEDGAEIRARNACITSDSVSFVVHESNARQAVATRNLRSIVVDPRSGPTVGFVVGTGALMGGIGLLSSVDFKNNYSSSGARLVGGAIASVFGFLIMAAAGLTEGNQYQIENSQQKRRSMEKSGPIDSTHNPHCSRPSAGASGG